MTDVQAQSKELNILIIPAYQTEGSRRKCRFYPNDTYSCEEEQTENSEKWSEHKRKLDELIAETRRRLKDLKVSIWLCVKNSQMLILNEMNQFCVC